MSRRLRHLGEALGFLGGALIGGGLLGGLGLVGLSITDGLVGGVLFFLSFVGFLFGIVAPLALVRYLGGREGSRVAKQLSTAAGYAAIVVVTVAVAAAALFLAPGPLADNPLLVLPAFDAVAGAVFGGLVGLELVRKRR